MTDLPFFSWPYIPCINSNSNNYHTHMLKRGEEQGTKTLILDFFIFYSRFPLMLHTGCNPFAEAWQLGPEIWVRRIQLASILEAPAVSGSGSEVWL